MNGTERFMGSDAFKCMLCGGETASPFLDSCQDYYLGHPLRASYRRCSGCGLVQQSPTPKDVGALYAGYPVHTPKSGLYSAVRRLLMSGVYRPPMVPPGGGLTLDYGCGDGWYLAWCKERGVPVIGFEKDAAHAARLSDRLGVQVYSDFDRLAADHGGALEMVTMHFVVEHLSDPAHVFHHLALLLKPGGAIRYVVPNIDSWEFRLFGRRWHSLDAPRHLLFPGPRHAEMLAADHALRFEGSRGVAFPNGFGGSVPTALLGRFSVAGMFAVLPLSLLLTTLFPGGNQAFVLRKPLDAAA